MSSLYDTNRVGQYLEQRVIDMRTQFESLSTRYAESIDAIESDRVHSLEEEIYSLKYAVELEREKNTHLESELVVARQEHRAEVEQLQSRMDILSTHFQLSVASRMLSEKKRVMATEQKRVLVKEVRGLRSRLDSSTDAVLQLMEANAKLSDAVRCLEIQVGDLKTNIDNLKALIAEHEGVRDLIITEQMMDESSSATATAAMEVVDVDGLLSSNEQVLESIRQASRCPPVEADNTATLLITSPSSATVIDIDKVSLSHLRDLDWLDADQQRSVQERMNASSQHHTVSGEVQHVPPSSGGRDEGGDEDSRSSVASRDSSTATDPSSSSSSSSVVGKSHYEDSAASVASAAAVPSSSSRSIASTVSSKLSLFTGAVGYSLLSGTGGGAARSSMHSSSSSSVTAEGIAAAAANHHHHHHHHHHHGDHYQGSSTTSTISGGDVSSSILSSVVPTRLSSMFTMSSINSANSLTPSKIEPPISGEDSASSSDQKALPSSVGNADNSVDGMSFASDAVAIELSVTLASATGTLSSSPTQPPSSSSTSSSSSSSTSSDTKPSDPPSGSSGSINESDRPSSSMRMVCLRCHGTVEGPKLSTCRCEEPAFSPEQLMTGISSAGSSSYGSESIKRSWGFASGVLFGVGSLVTSMTASSSSAAVSASTSSSSVSADPHTSSSSSHGAAGSSISSVPQINSSDAATDGPLLGDSGSMTLYEEDNNAIAQCAEYLDGDGNDDATASVCEDLSL